MIVSILNPCFPQDHGPLPLFDRMDLIRGELRTLAATIEYKREIDGTPKLEVFSTKNVPGWCADQKYVRTLLSKEGTITFNKNYASSFYRPWSYETTPEAVAVDYEKLSKKTVIMVASDSSGKIFGITKNMDYVDYRFKK